MAWRNIKLGEFLTQRRDRIPIEPGTLYKQITVRLWGKGISHRATVDGTEIAADAQVAIQAGDFLISKIDARHGAFGLVPEALSGGVVSTDFPCFEINRSIAEPTFLEWYSRTPKFVALCKQASRGSTNRVRLKEKLFLELEVPLPPLSEQRLLAEQLNSIRDAHDEAIQIIQNIEADTTALFYSLHRKFAGHSKREAKRFLNLVEIRETVEPTGSYPQLGIRGYGNGLFFKDAVSGSETSYKKFNRIYEGCLVVSQPKGWEGAIDVASKQHDGWFVSPEYRTFECNEAELTPAYLRELIKTSWFQFELSRMTKGQGARRERLRPEMLLQFRLAVPPIDKQAEILDIIGYARQLSRPNQSIEREFDALLSSAMHYAFDPRKKREAYSSNSADKKSSLSTTTSDDKIFDEAILVGAIVKAFTGNGEQTLGNFRLQKSVYFARRYLGERALDREFLRKAAGPYNPSMRYSGGIKIAEDKSWIVRTEGSYGDGTALGDKAAELNAWIEKYDFSRVASWVRDKFKFRKNEQWELLATVDYAALALEKDGISTTASNILEYIQRDQEWRSKIDKLSLTEAVIQNVLVELQSLNLR